MQTGDYTTTLFDGTPNQVDAAIARVYPNEDISIGMMCDYFYCDGAQQTPIVGSACLQPVGLFFAGGYCRFMSNYFSLVAQRLGIYVPDASGAAVPIASPARDMQVQKCGRISGYTDSRISEVEARITIAASPLNPQGTSEWTNQFAVASNEFGTFGDSGSLVVTGGTGVFGDFDWTCDLPAPVGDIPLPIPMPAQRCSMLYMGEQVLGLPLKQESDLTYAARDVHLAPTRLGHYLIRLYYANERRLLERVDKAEITNEDRTFARELYARYHGQAQLAIFDPDSVVVTEQQFKDAWAALHAAETHLAAKEFEAAKDLFQVFARAQGMSGRQALELLNDPAIYDRVRSIVKRLSFLEDVQDP